MMKCPDIECHDTVQRNNQSIAEIEGDISGLKDHVYGVKGAGGVLGKDGIRDCLNKKQDKGTIRTYLLSSLGVLIVTSGLVASMWAQTLQVPENKDDIEDNKEKISDIKKDVAVLEKAEEKNEKDIDDMKEKIDKMYEVIVLGAR